MYLLPLPLPLGKSCTLTGNCSIWLRQLFILCTSANSGPFSVGSNRNSGSCPGTCACTHTNTDSHSIKMSFNDSMCLLPKNKLTRAKTECATSDSKNQIAGAHLCFIIKILQRFGQIPINSFRGVAGRGKCDYDNGPIVIPMRQSIPVSILLIINKACFSHHRYWCSLKS